MVKTIALHLQDAEQDLLKTVESGNKQKIRPQLIAMYRDTCTPCHTSFRTPYQ